MLQPQGHSHAHAAAGRAGLTITGHICTALFLQTTATATGTVQGAQLWTHVCHARPTVQQSPQQRPAPPDPANVNKCCPWATSSQTA